MQMCRYLNHHFTPLNAATYMHLNVSTIFNGINAEHTEISGLRIFKSALPRTFTLCLKVSLLLGPVMPPHCTLRVPQFNVRHQNEIIFKPIPSKPLNDTIMPIDCIMQQKDLGFQPEWCRI